MAGKSVRSKKGRPIQKPTGGVSSQQPSGSTQNRAQCGPFVHVLVRKCLSYIYPLAEKDAREENCFYS